MSNPVYRAMADQLDRVNSQAAERADTLRHEILKLKREMAGLQEMLQAAKEENDRLANLVRLRPGRSLTAARGVVEVATARPVGTQAEYARLHNVKQYSVSRWVAAGKLAGTAANGRSLVYLDQDPPAPRQRKPKTT